MAAVIPFLILFPMCFAVLVYFIRVSRIRSAVSYVGCAVIIAATLYLVFDWVRRGQGSMRLYMRGMQTADHIVLAAELALMVFITYCCLKHKRWYISLLSIIPTLAIAWLELFGPLRGYGARVYIDNLTILMCLIVGIIGSLIIVYAVGYMHGYHLYHVKVPDRRSYFFFVLFFFIGAMFGFVLSADLLWIDLFWEITTVCSYLLIEYTTYDDAVANAFRALWMNLLGGCALAAAILIYVLNYHTSSLTKLVNLGIAGSPIALMAITLIAFAALTKTAQLPFSEWLLGAMVAPTPSSALLHSATMVKAGIYILFRLSPAMYENLCGTMVSFIGGFTFLAASFMAIAQDDGKKVLALSTISNLGLMVACAGVGRAEALWAGVFLLIFHAVSKSLLFQDLGATENALHSRDIEVMQGLLYRLPRLAVIMFIGICGMYLAPFGMLISKWAALKAAVDERNIILVFFICFGSATTSFYWTKWLGKLITRTSKPPVKDITRKNEMVSLIIHTCLMIGICVFFPLLSIQFVDPLVAEIFYVYEQVISNNVLILLVFMILFFFAVPVFAYFRDKKMAMNRKLSYMSGINTGNNDAFVNSFGEEQKLVVSNLYFKSLFARKVLMFPSKILAAGVIIVMLSLVIGGVYG